MKILKFNKEAHIKYLFILLLTWMPVQLLNAQQRIGFGIHADPVISWFSPDISQVKSNGARAGFNFGLSYNKYFAPNYAFSAGIDLLSAGGRLIHSDTTVINISGVKATVLPGKPVTYRLQYLAFPVGLKLKTNEIGYLCFFSDLGLVPKIVVSRKLDIPSLSLSDQNASDELNMFNLSYHITAGVEYSLGGSTALVFGLDFDNNFLDITKESENQRADKVSQKMLSFRLGVNF